MVDEHGILIVGAGQTAASACATLRAEGYAGPITVVGEEPDLPYERPALSKQYLAGSQGIDDLTIRRADWYADNDVGLRRGERVVGVRPEAHAAELESGETLPYAQLLIATGGRARTVPGLSGDRVHHLRTRADADRLASALQPGTRLAVLGGGFIGCEVAATAGGLGCRVTLLEMAPTPLHAVLGPEIGAQLAELHSRHGIEVRAGERFVSAQQDAHGVLLTTDRGTVEADVVLVALGMLPAVEWLNGSGIEVDGGVCVDGHGHTSTPDVFAAGDVAAVRQSDGRLLRMEHYDQANRQGASVARAMLGLDPADQGPPYFWSDQYDHTLQVLGHTDGDLVVRRLGEGHAFADFHVTDGLVRGVVALDLPAAVAAGRRLIRTGTVLDDPQDLADPTIEPARVGRQRAEARR